MPSDPIDRLLNPDDRQHMTAARCPNGHTEHYDKRLVCPPTGVVFRGGGHTPPDNPDEVQLICPAEGCGVEFVVGMDCTGYR